jgi:holo-[acyl-carrier protein] synthase
VILGIGIELLEVSRFRASLARFDARWRARVFTEGEQEYAAARRRGETQSLAVRFAAKCAARRALAVATESHARGIAWREIEVVRKAGRPPALRLHGHAEKVAAEAGVQEIALSLTHDRSACMAHVVVEGDTR